MLTEEKIADPSWQISARSQESQQSPIGTRERLVGIDSLRFVCALIVMLGHLGPVAGGKLTSYSANPLSKLAVGLVNCLFNGPAAVIVFFVISGFCIHFPFRNGRKVALSPFYVRRFLRIIPPAIAFTVVNRALLKDNSSIQDTVLWSVLCETIYYSLYPLLVVLRKLSSWMVMIGFSSVLAAIAVMTHLNALRPSSHSYTALGNLTWLLGLPCWLLGCWLAENYLRFSVPSTWRMWLLRSAILVSSIVLRFGKFHFSSVLGSNAILLDPFAILVCIWLGVEVMYARKHEPSRLLESAGRWSYSLYLVHPLTIPLLALSGLTSHVWLFRFHLTILLAALGGSYLFYLTVEKPSHRLAVWAGRAVLKREVAEAS